MHSDEQQRLCYRAWECAVIFFDNSVTKTVTGTFYCSTTFTMTCKYKTPHTTRKAMELLIPWLIFFKIPTKAIGSVILDTLILCRGGALAS